MHNAKAAQIRHVMRWLFMVMLRPFVSVTPMQRVRLTVFANWHTFEQTCKEAGRYFTAQQLHTVQDCVEEALLGQNTLNADAIACDSLFWHQVPKNHMCTHMVFDLAVVANPRIAHCYADEDLVGKMKRIMARCHGATAGRTGMLRYTILACTRWWTHSVKPISEREIG